MIRFAAGATLGVLTGFLAAAFVVGRSAPCKWCGEGAPYKVEPHREVMGQ